MEYPHHQNSNPHQPPTTPLPQNHNQLQTQILPNESNPSKQSIQLHHSQTYAQQHNSQQLSNSHHQNQQKQASENQIQVVEDLFVSNQPLATYQIQPRQHHPVQLIQQQIQPTQADRSEEQFLLANTQDAMLIGPSHLNPHLHQSELEAADSNIQQRMDINQQKTAMNQKRTDMNQQRIGFQVQYQAQIDLLNFGTTLQEQIQRQNRQSSYAELLLNTQQQNHEPANHSSRKHEPMDIQSHSKVFIHQQPPTNYSALYPAGQPWQEVKQQAAQHSNYQHDSFQNIQQTHLQPDYPIAQDFQHQNQIQNEPAQIQPTSSNIAQNTDLVQLALVNHETPNCQVLEQQNKLVPAETNLQIDQTSQHAVSQAKPEQKKDELPSEILQDQWEVIDDSINNRQLIPMQIQSISGIKPPNKQNNFTSFDTSQPIQEEYHSNHQKESNPANSILNKSFILSSEEIFSNSQHNQQPQEASIIHQQHPTNSVVQMAEDEKQNQWYQTRQISQEWKVQKQNMVVNRLISYYQRREMQQPSYTPTSTIDNVKKLHETDSRDSNLSKLQKSYVVAVRECGEQEEKIQHSLVKNNDIYGYEVNAQSISNREDPVQPDRVQDLPQQQLQEKQNFTGQYPKLLDIHQKEQLKLDQSKPNRQPEEALDRGQNQPLNQQNDQQHPAQNISNRQQKEKEQYGSQQQDKDSLRQYYQHQQEQQISVESVMKQLQNIFQNLNHEADQYRFQQFQSIIKRHIDLIYIKPKDMIGQTILENGELTIILAELMVLNSPFQQERAILQKYLVAMLSHNIKINQQIYQTYKNKFWPRKSDQFTLVNQVSIRKSQHKQKLKAEQETISNYSIEVHDATSIRQGQHSIMKSNHRPKITQPRTEMPVKRAAMEAQGRSRSRGNETKQIGAQLNEKNKLRETKKRVTMRGSNLGSYDQTLGLAQTFVTMLDRDGKQMLQRVKVSRRLLQKSKKKDQKEQKDQKQRKTPRRLKHPRNAARVSLTIQHEQQPTNNENKSPKRVHSGRKVIKRSARKTDNENQVLNGDYLKSHFQEIKIDQDLIKQLNGSFLTQADKQIAKILQQYQKAVDQEERIRLDLEISQKALPQDQDQNYQHNQQQSSNPVSLRRRQQLQRQLQKIKLRQYRIMQQLTQNHIILQKVIDPDINGHGIYALVKVKKSTATLLRARYFLMPMSKLELCSRKLIDEDISTIRSLVEEAQRDNIGILNPSVKLQQLVEIEKKKREKKQNKQKA